MSNHIQSKHYAIAFTRSATQIGTHSQVQICNQIAEKLGVQIIGWQMADGEYCGATAALPILSNALTQARITPGVHYLIASDCSRLTRRLETFSEIGRELGDPRISLATQSGVVQFPDPTTTQEA